MHGKLQVKWTSRRRTGTFDKLKEWLTSRNKKEPRTEGGAELNLGPVKRQDTKSEKIAFHLH